MLAFAFSNQVSLGNIVTLLVFAVVAGGSYYRLKGLRSEELEASSDFWREQVEPLKDVIEAQRDQLAQIASDRDGQRAAKHALKSELAALELKTDLTAVVAAFAESHQALVKRMELAEQNGLSSVTGLEEKMVVHFGALSETQATMTETLRGLLQQVSALNKKT